jgi:hypothetical protein
MMDFSVREIYLRMLSRGIAYSDRCWAEDCRLTIKILKVRAKEGGLWTT